MSNFSISHSVFKRLVLQAGKNKGFFDKGLKYGFYSPASIDRGHIVLAVSVRLLNAEPVKTFSYNFPYYSSYNAHIRYAGSFRQYPTSEGHIIMVKVEYQGYISQKMVVSGALVFHKHILF